MKNFWQKFFSIFKQAWFWWLLGLILLCAIVWFLLPLLSLGSAKPFASAAVRLTLILIFVLVWAIVNIILVKRAKKAEEATPVTDPEQITRALSLLKLNFTKAYEIIAPGTWSKKYFNPTKYALPWYLTLGAPKSGRSSLLKYSGLPYPVANESYQQITQAEDELCQFWFSKAAVIIDTQADLLTETTPDSVPQRVWLELLALLKSYRRKQPLNGVILCIDLQDLLLKSEEDRANLAHTLRVQLQTLNNKLGIQCPLYICFTKADLISGFNEYFAEINSEQMAQPFGVTLPFTRQHDSVQHFGKEYDKLIERLQQQLIARLHASKNPRQAALVENYPNQMQSIKANLQQFLIDVFETNHYQQPQALRGVFFTSSLQEGTPTDCLEATSSQAYGIEVVNEQKKITHNPYFVNSFFSQVVFLEKNILLFNPQQTKYQNFRHYFSYAITGAIILIFAYLWMNSYLLNKERLSLLNEQVSQFHKVTADLSSQNRLLHILPMLDELNSIRQAFDPENDPRSMYWGLYQGHKIDQITQEVYRQNLAIYFMPYVIDVITTELNNPAAKPNQIYNALRVYLMLANPERLNKEFVQNWLHVYWQKKYVNQPRTIVSLDNNLQALLSMPLKPITVNATLVEAARAKLHNTTQAERDYFELQELAEIAPSNQLHISSGLDLDFKQVFGADAVQLSVPILYTRQGYEEIYQAQLQKIADNQNYSNWVLGETAQQSLNKSDSQAESQVTQLYMRDYIAYWNKILDGLNIANFNTLSQASSVLGILADQNNSPVYEILQVLQTNTALSEPTAEANGNSAIAKTGNFLKQNKTLVNALQPSAVKSATSKVNRFVPKKSKKKGATTAGNETAVEQTPVEAHFAAINGLLESNDTTQPDQKEGAVAETPYDQIQQALDKLYEYVLSINTASNKNEAAYNAVMQHLAAENPAEDPLAQLLQQANAAPQPVKRWLQAIAENTWSALLDGARDYITQQYLKQLYPDYQQLILNKVPFYKGSKDDISLTAFTQFFAPEGKFDQFFNKYLKPFIDTEQTQWAWKIIAGRSLPIAESTLQQFQRAETIKNVFFGTEKTAKFAYSIQVQSLSAALKSADLELNGESLIYRHGPKRDVNFTWPREGGNNSYSLTLVNLSDKVTRFTARDEWGSFVLFNSGSARDTNKANEVVVSFSAGGQSVSYLISSDKTINPFSPKLLPEFRLPENLEAN